MSELPWAGKGADDIVAACLTCGVLRDCLDGREIKSSEHFPSTSEGSAEVSRSGLPCRLGGGLFG